MWIDLRETFFQLRALVRLCFFRPNSWREIAIAAITLTFLPLIILICLLSNVRYDQRNRTR